MVDHESISVLLVVLTRMNWRAARAASSLWRFLLSKGGSTSRHLCGHVVGNDATCQGYTISLSPSRVLFSKGISTIWKEFSVAASCWLLGYVLHHVSELNQIECHEQSISSELCQPKFRCRLCPTKIGGRTQHAT